MTTLSIRRLWPLYKRVSVAHGIGSSRRDLALAQVAFYSGARGGLKVQPRLIELGDCEEHGREGLRYRFRR